MSENRLLVADYVLQDLQAAVKMREPRALELAYALALALPDAEGTTALRAATSAVQDATPFEISSDVREMLEYAIEKYDALTRGDLERADLGNVNVLAFERRAKDERLLIVNNLARVSQPIKFQNYAGKQGWDILNRVEFTFPPRAQLEMYEFLWLMID